METLEKLKDYRDLIDKWAPCGVTAEKALADQTSVQINAPRALMMTFFKGQIAALVELRQRDFLMERRSQAKSPRYHLSRAEQYVMAANHCDLVHHFCENARCAIGEIAKAIEAAKASGTTIMPLETPEP